MQQIKSICRNFLWCGHEHFVSGPLVKWEQLCQPKRKGGLGILNMDNWNKAALGKYIWWIAQKQDRLWIKWIHAVYLKTANWQTHKPGQMQDGYGDIFVELRRKSKQGIKEIGCCRLVISIQFRLDIMGCNQK